MKLTSKTNPPGLFLCASLALTLLASGCGPSNTSPAPSPSLTSSDPAKRIQALQALNEFDEMNTPTATKLVLTDPDPTVRFAALKFIRNKPAAQAPSAKLAFADPSTEVRCLATSMLDDPQALLQLCRDPLERVSIAAMLQLASFADPPDAYLSALQSTTNSALVFQIAARAVNQSVFQTALNLLPEEYLINLVVYQGKNYEYPGASYDRYPIHFNCIRALKAFARLHSINPDYPLGIQNKDQRVCRPITQLRNLHLALKELSPDLSLRIGEFAETSEPYYQTVVPPGGNNLPRVRLPGAKPDLYIRGVTLSVNVLRGQIPIANRTWAPNLPNETMDPSARLPDINLISLLSEIIQQTSPSPEFVAQRAIDSKSPYLRLAYAHILPINHPALLQLALQDADGDVRYDVVRDLITDEFTLRKLDSLVGVSNTTTGSHTLRNVSYMAYQKLKKLHLEPGRSSPAGTPVPRPAGQ